MFKKKFLNTIRKFRMLKPGETVYAAVSGGLDSSVLLRLLDDLKDEWKLKIGVLHVNHGLRGKASDRDERFVQKLAERFQIPFLSVRVNVKEKAKLENTSIEEAAREARYEFFEKMCTANQINKVALAHTQDDQAETVLMRIIQGTGLQGLQAIRPKRKLNGSYVIRPLIEIPKKEILKYARAHKIRFQEDATNRSLQYLRNRIRLKLIPFLERSFNPQVKKALARLPHLLDADLGFLDETAGACYKRLAVHEGGNQISFPKRAFLKLHSSIQYRLIQRGLYGLAAAELNYEHWNDFSASLSAGGRFKFQFSKKIIAAVSQNHIDLHAGKKTPVSFDYDLNLNESLYLPEADITLSCQEWNKPKKLKKTNPSFEFLDCSLLQFPLTVRNRKEGDRFVPLGQKKSTKLKKLLINKRIPVEKRNRLPVVLSHDQIVWVGGVALSDRFKITQNTKRFVRLSIKPAKDVSFPRKRESRVWIPDESIRG